MVMMVVVMVMVVCLPFTYTLSRSQSVRQSVSHTVDTHPPTWKNSTMEVKRVFLSHTHTGTHTLSVSPSVRPSVSQSASQSASQSISQTVSQSVSGHPPTDLEELDHGCEALLVGRHGRVQVPDRPDDGLQL